MAMSNASYGRHPSAAGVTTETDQVENATEDMSSACEQAQTDAQAHQQRTAGQIGMRTAGA